MYPDEDLYAALGGDGEEEDLEGEVGEFQGVAGAGGEAYLPAVADPEQPAAGASAAPPDEDITMMSDTASVSDTDATLDPEDDSAVERIRAYIQRHTGK